jgi:hypothetical protein
MTARSLVDSAYAGVGRYGSGSQMNQVDPEGRQYYEKLLNSGAVAPQDLAGIFNDAINLARQNQSNPAYSKFLQNQTGYSGGYQGFMPQMQNPFSSSGGMGGGMGSGNTLTPELARSLMQRAMTTGLPKSESDKYGGYAAISALYDSYGGTRDTVGQQATSRPLQFNPYTNRPSYSAGAPQMQTPFSYQQPASQANSGFNYSAPMQLPQYVYDTNRDVGLYQSQPIQAFKSTRPVSSGPSQAIVGRSSQMRGTPNVMAAPVARAKGGIASLLKKHK